MNAPLSKSRFLSGMQCELRLWLAVHAPDLAAAPDPVREQVFAAGHEVGRLARDRFPGGVLVAADQRDPEAALAATRRALADPRVPAIYEAAVEHRGVRVRVDVLVRRAAAFDLVEVKSTTSVKAVHDLDVAVQTWVLRGAGVALGRVGVLTLDRGYRWPGGDYELGALFRLHDRGEAVAALLPGISADVARLHAVLAAERAPAVVPGAQCTSPYECPFLGHCTRDAVEPEWPLSVLPRLGARHREALEAAGVVDVRDVPPDFPLNPLQGVVREATVGGADVVHGDLSRALHGLEPPVHHLDFEAVTPALPRWPGTRPYDAVPFQFSVHTEEAGGAVRHAEYLHTDAGDPREPLAQALLDALGTRGRIAVWSGYEKRVIRALAGDLPALAPALEALLPRLHDLLPAVRGSYYHPAFRGSFSIKSVLPALAPELDYGDLDIADGGIAAARWLEAIGGDDAAARDRTFAQLRAYCRRDTEGLVCIRRVLADRAARDAAGAPR